MPTRASRAFELALAAACATPALLKLGGAPAGGQVSAAGAVAGVVEAVVAAWLVVGARPRLAAWSVVVLGVAFASAAAVAKPDGGDCGCLGPFHADQARRLVVAGILIALAGARLAFPPGDVVQRAALPA